MKTKKTLNGFLILICLTAHVAYARQSTMNVQVHQGNLRQRPSYIANVVGVIEYGERVTVLDSQSGWVRVLSADNTEGWIHESALTSRRVVLSSGTDDAQVKASSEEVTMAGRGFNAEVEKEFKEQNRQVDFTWVDRMEAQEVPFTEIAEFLRQGQVSAEEGGSR